MRYILGLVVAAGLWLGTASAAQAQFSLSVGGPWGGVSVGVPYVGAYGGYYAAPYSGYGYSAVPGTTYYSSGYYGVTPGVPVYSYPYGYTSYYGYAPYYRYGYYGPSYGGFYGLRRGYWGGIW
jgi:hypothetical protein